MAPAVAARADLDLCATKKQRSCRPSEKNKSPKSRLLRAGRAREERIQHGASTPLARLTEASEGLTRWGGAPVVGALHYVLARADAAAAAARAVRAGKYASGGITLAFQAA